MINSPIKSFYEKRLVSAPFITQVFGKNPAIYNQFGLKGHNGIDFRASIGTPIHSPIAGIIYEVGDQGDKGYGKFVRIRSPYGLEIVLAHLSRIDVKKDQKIPLGDLIGLSGNTGFSTGAHLHMGVRRYDTQSGRIQNTDNGFAGYEDFNSYLIQWYEEQ